MLSRRTFLGSAAATTFIPRIAGAVTEAPKYTQWPQIQGPAANSQRTRFIKGDGIGSIPVNTAVIRPDLSFLQNVESNPSMVLTAGMVIARAMGPEFPLVAIDSRTGELAWERKRVERILGVFQNLVFVVAAPENPTSYPILKAIVVEGPSDLWATAEHEISGAVVIPDEALILSRVNDRQVELVSRELRSGKVQWTRDITNDVDMVPAIFATNGTVVIGTNDPVKKSTHIYAWNVEEGSLLWQLRNPHFLSSPAFHENDLVIASVDGVLRIDAESGEIIDTIDMPQYIGGLVKLALTEEYLVLVDSMRIHAINWDTGQPEWSRAPKLASSTRDLMVYGSMILRVEKEEATSFRENSIRGYDLATGRLVLDFRPTDSDENAVNMAAFLVARENFYLATNNGVGAWFPGDSALEQPVDPMMDRAFSNNVLGFSYSWDEEWEALGSSQMTPQGLLLEHVEGNRYVAQSAGPPSDFDGDFTRAWHAYFGPYDDAINGIRPADAPDLDFLPDTATTHGVVYLSTQTALGEVWFGLRVLIPFGDDQRLMFDYLQRGEQVDDRIDSFQTFFENLVID